MTVMARCLNVGMVIVNIPGLFAGDFLSYMTNSNKKSLPNGNILLDCAVS
jgi:hypothetical protein